jgi:hypothetical protein
MIKGGKTSTYKKKEAKSLLYQIMAMGDTVPIGCIQRIDDV